MASNATHKTAARKNKDTTHKKLIHKMDGRYVVTAPSSGRGLCIIDGILCVLRVFVSVAFFEWSKRVAYRRIAVTSHEVTNDGQPSLGMRLEDDNFRLGELRLLLESA